MAISFAKCRVCVFIDNIIAGALFAYQILDAAYHAV